MPGAQQALQKKIKSLTLKQHSPERDIGFAMPGHNHHNTSHFWPGYPKAAPPVMSSLQHLVGQPHGNLHTTAQLHRGSAWPPGFSWVAPIKLFYNCLFPPKWRSQLSCMGLHTSMKFTGMFHLEMGCGSYFGPEGALCQSTGSASGSARSGEGHLG